MMQSIRNGGNKVWNVDKAYLDEQLWHNHVGAYYALATEVDHCVGEILKALDESGIAEEIIVIYTSDHGDFVGNHGMVDLLRLKMPKMKYPIKGQSIAMALTKGAHMKREYRK
jgi:arylsulfatase A-like enzyme